MISRLSSGDPRVLAADALLATTLPGAAWRLRDELTKAHAVGLVAEGDRGVEGALVAWLVVYEVHLLSVGVAPSARRRGVGAALLDALGRAGREAGCGRVLLEVDAGNVAARALYARAGFVEVNVRRAYYADGGDAVELSLALTDDP
ncbi:MAG: GNAT family N-acetyltransferase [Polyangiaceae bacterium]|nr:GNAT family N-acetyltransferase [Polyangiaceae bacterium]